MAAKKKSARSASRKHSSRRSTKARRIPRTAEQFFAMPEADQENWAKLTAVIGTMRGRPRDSLRKISAEIGIRPDVVTTLGSTALRKRSNGRYSAKTGDQLLRVFRVLTPEGPIDIGVRGSRQASTVGEYWAAVQKYIATGDATSLDKLQGKEIRDATGSKITLITDTHQLKRLGYAGQLSFESIYARSA